MGSEGLNGTVLVTGAAGGIGQALVRSFANGGYDVVATDRGAAPADLRCLRYLECDLQALVEDERYAAGVLARVRDSVGGRPLRGLINNAAVQILGPVENLDRSAWQATLCVNLLAPFFLTQALLPELETAGGTVLNISSIHANHTKKNFAAYATSKAALSGLTRAMAVELGDRVRINGIAPAAIETPMLRAGFADDEAGFQQLNRMHPAGRIGRPDELAAFALTIVRDGSAFMNGAILDFDGGIGSVLADPALFPAR
jgi:NAD(P)-dependent dehydrogenase (short-subunit alcohol dehydrogenase family)